MLSDASMLDINPYEKGEGIEIYNQKEPNADKSNGLTWTESYKNAKLIVNPFNHNEPYRKKKK